MSLELRSEREGMVRSDSVVCASRGAAVRGPRMQIRQDRVRRLLVLSHAYLGVDRTACAHSIHTYS